MNKKEWLDKLYYDIGKQQYDFFVCGLKKMPDDSIIATKWKKYSEVCFNLDSWESYKIEWVNQRQILPIEIVLDFDDDKLSLEEIREKLQKIPIGNYMIFDSGSRGYHVHIFSLIEVSRPVKEFFCKYFGSDVAKAGEKTMIALEYCPHWKTGKIKQLIETENGRPY